GSPTDPAQPIDEPTPDLPAEPVAGLVAGAGDAAVAAEAPAAGDGTGGDGTGGVGAVVDDIEAAGCLLDDTEVAAGDTGGSVECAQRALRAAGFYDGEVTGTFDDATWAAARAFQAELGLYVDGIVGKNTATELGIWPGQEAF